MILRTGCPPPLTSQGASRSLHRVFYHGSYLCRETRERTRHRRSLRKCQSLVKVPPTPLRKWCGRKPDSIAEMRDELASDFRFFFAKLEPKIDPTRLPYRLLFAMRPTSHPAYSTLHKWCGRKPTSLAERRGELASDCRFFFSKLEPIVEPAHRPCA